MELKKQLYYFGVLMILGVLIYLPSLDAPFVWDDVVIIRDNPFIGSNLKLKVQDLLPGDNNYFSISKEGTYRPLATLSYYLTGLVSGKEPSGYRLLNIILNGLSAILVMVLGARFWGRDVGLIGGLLFVLHPVHGETIFIASFNEDILMAVFFLLGFILYQDYKSHSGKSRPTYLVGSAVSFFLACMAKEPAIVFPAVIFIYEKLCATPSDCRVPAFPDNAPYRPEEQRENNEHNSRRQQLIAYLVYCFTVVVYIWLRFVVAGGGRQFVLPSAGDIAVNFLTRGLPSFFKYLSLSLWPFEFQIDRVGVFKTFDIAAGMVLAGWVGYLSFIRYRQQSGFWAGLFILPLVPVMNIIPFYFYPVTSERYLYLSSVSVCILGALALSRIKPPVTRNLSVISILLIFSVAILERSLDYKKSNLEFWRDAFESSPGSFMAANSLGNEYKKQGDLTNAEFYYKKSIEINPDYAEAFVNLASVYALKKEYDQSLDYYKKAIERNPNLSKAYSGMGIVYMWQGKLKEAEFYLKKSLELDKTLVGAYHFLAGIYEKEGRLEEAVDMYKKVLEFDASNPDEINNLAFVLAQLHRYEEAIAYWRKMTDISPESPDGWLNMGNIYFMKKQYADAAICYQKVLEINPGHSAAKSNLEKIKSIREKISG